MSATSSENSGSRHRLSSRILLFDEQGRVLLFLTKAPSGDGSRWITPGGGVDEGESHHEAAIRELFEETGLVVETLGHPVWQHDFDATWGATDHDTGHAEYFAHVTTGFEPSNAHWTPEEHLDVLEHRWWSVDKLLQTDDPYEPAELVQLVQHELNHR